VIVPILFKGKEKVVIDAAKDVKKKIEKLGVRVHLDDRDYSAGFKFNDWELRGVPLRIEIGPKDIEKKEITYVRRIGGRKDKLKIAKIKDIKVMLQDIQKEMYEKSKKFQKDNIHDAKTMAELKKMTGFARVNWCGSEECHDNIKFESGGMEIRGTLYNKKEKTFGVCIHCGKRAIQVVYLARAY